MNHKATPGQKPKKLGKVADLVRFLIAGGANTLLTLVLYQLLLFAFLPHWAYALSWFAGIAFVIIVYPSRVFVGGRSGLSDRLILGVFYAGIFLVGLATLEFLTRTGVHSRFAILFSVAATMLMNFVVARFLLRRPQ